MSHCALILLPLLLLIRGNYLKLTARADDRNYWSKHAERDIETSRGQARTINENVARNVILFIGDGMGPSTVTSARIYGKGVDGHLAFETFPHMGTLKTYSAQKYVPESASTATALYTGVKVNHRIVGLASTIFQDDCMGSLDQTVQLDGIFQWARDANIATGFVTTTRVTHATPAALYAHSANRKWECDNAIPERVDPQRRCKDIGRQLVEDNAHIRVIMGGGRQCLRSNITGPVDKWTCRADGNRDLITQWIAEKRSRSVKHQFVQTNAELASVSDHTEYLLGVFANSHLPMEFERDRGPNGSPSLANMTTAALKVLRRHERFMLVVEGGLIDFAHHRGKMRKALDETIAFSDAVEAAQAYIRDVLDDTLIIVTADHAHSDVLVGHADRNGDVGILGIAQKSKIDAINYTSLLYATGGVNNFQFAIKGDKILRDDPSWNDTTDFDYSQQAAILTDEVTHSGVDVLVYAQGPWAHLLRNVHEQTHVAYVISYAAQIGPLTQKSQAGSSDRMHCSIIAQSVIVICLAILLVNIF